MTRGWAVGALRTPQSCYKSCPEGVQVLVTLWEVASWVIGALGWLRSGLSGPITSFMMRKCCVAMAAGYNPQGQESAGNALCTTRQYPSTVLGCVALGCGVLGSTVAGPAAAIQP